MVIETKILENFIPYIKNKEESDYLLKENVPTDTFFMIQNESGYFRDETGKLIITDEFVHKLSPDKIDSRHFWKVATHCFPLFSIAGGQQTIVNVDGANELTLKMASSFGVLLPVHELFSKKPKAKILEIGPGHGGFAIALLGSYKEVKYHAIDVNPLFTHPNFYQTDGKTIPNKVPKKLDMVYSFNVFQHLSKAQRSSYYSQIYDRLNINGEFIFGMFVVNETNKDWPAWGYRGNNGEYYCQFFKQFTQCDWEHELFDELNKIGFKVEKLSNFDNQTNYLSYKAKKSTF